MNLITDQLIDRDSFCGTHDFKHFSSIRKKKGTEKEIKTITFVTEESTLYIRMTANDFLYQMAPFILGTLLDIVEAVNEGKEITKADLQRCAKHILSVALKTM